MYTTLAPELRKLVKIFGWYQIVGGAYGVVILLLQLNAILSLTGLNLLIYGFFFLLFIFSILCGVFCIQLKPFALTYSMINQCLQIFSFNALGVIFSYVSGIGFIVSIAYGNMLDIHFNINLTTIMFYINNTNDSPSVGVNIIAVVLIFQINKVMKKVKRSEPEIDLIGTIENN